MNPNFSKCPVCGEGELSPQTFSEVFTINGQKIVVHDLEGSLCNVCGADPILQPQILRNQALIADAKRAHLGLLKGSQIKLIRETLGLTQKQAAEKFGGGPNAFSKYERGEVIQSEPMDKLLRAVLVAPRSVSYLDSDFAVIYAVSSSIQESAREQALAFLAAPSANYEVSHFATAHLVGSIQGFQCVLRSQDFQEEAAGEISDEIPGEEDYAPSAVLSRPYKKVSGDGWGWA